jgi:hypothetical protein
MKAVTPDEKELIYQLYDFGKSAEEIGEFINRSARCVEEQIRLRSEPAFFDHTPSGRRVYTDDFKTELRKLSAEGKSIKELGNQFHMHRGTVHGIVKGEVTPEPVAVPEPEQRQTTITIPLEHKYVFYLGIGAEELKMINHLVKHFVQEFDKR